MANNTLQLLASKLSDIQLELDVSDDTLNAVNQATYAETLSSVARVQPNSLEQLQNVVRVAKELSDAGHDIKLFTVSSGKNWGYGSSTPSAANTVLLSLKYMSTEPEWVRGSHEKGEPYGKELGIVKLGPGVTQQSLYDFLQKEGGMFWMDATGSSPDCSVLANYITRGFGHTKAGDHADHIAGMEVVLPSGKLLKTGHGGCKNASNVGVHKHGIGPYIDGMFSQSNLGIVTTIYVQLIPAQKYTYKFFIKLNNTNQFLNAIQRLAPLKLNGVLDSQMHCGNQDKAIQAVMRFPFDKVPDDQNSIPAALKEQICKDYNLPAWTISGAIYSNSLFSHVLKYFYFTALFMRLGKPIILPVSLVKWLNTLVNKSFFEKHLPNAHKKMRPTLMLLKELLGLKQGKPTDFFLEGVNHKKKTPCIVKNPDANHVGLIWLAPIAPLHKDYARLLIDHSVTILEKHGFDCPLSLTLLNTRALECIIAIVYDRDNQQEEAKAMACHDELLSTFNALGLTNYRSSIRAMQQDELNYSEELTEFLMQLKATIDPNSLFSENYYIPAKQKLGK